MSDESEKILKFPEVPREPEVLYHCKACDHKITDVMEENDDAKAKVLPLNIGGVMIYVCPNCYTLQLPQELYEEILRKATSNIIT